ncbi:hydrolase-4 domain-containing protein [Favolaschia claudopus]|uniref:Hydrolase-4 domain-containing protein n=1 Tax=Favolaschia claudopus TaxID=2862362 RepID=A0AAW0EJ26_9AGAR
MSPPLPYTEAWLPGPHSTQFYTRVYKPSVDFTLTSVSNTTAGSSNSPTAILVFLHGAAEHCGRYTGMHEALANEGIVVWAFDLRGFGRTALGWSEGKGRSEYGNTDKERQMDDVEWAIGCVRKEYGEEVPVFLMGMSMGGGLALGVMCDERRTQHEAVQSIRGVIAASPCLTLTKGVPRVVMWVARAVALFWPYKIFPVKNKPEDLSRNPITNAEYLADPLIKTPGSFRSILDMIDLGASILSDGYLNWPKDTPVLLLHGTDDPVTSFESTKLLFEKLTVSDDMKSSIAYPDAYHELHNEPDGVREKFLADIVNFIRTQSVSEA